MENINLEYDKRSPKSIENYAKKLLGKSFREVIDNDNNGINDKNGEDYGASDVDEKKRNKGNLGELIEEKYFHYKNNNDARPDFEEAGVELKVTPYKQLKNGKISAKERLVVNKIDYQRDVNIDFEHSHFWRKSSNGHEYIYSEGPIPMIDSADKPARTMLTSEGSFNRSTHIVKDKKTGNIRLLTPIEMERIQGFPDNWTKECLIDGAQVEMPLNKRRFMMGNALVVDLIRQMEPVLSDIFENEYLFSGKQNSEEPPFLTLNDHTEITYSDIKRNKHGQEYVTIHFETPIANKLASMDINTDDDVLRHVKGYTAGKVTEMIDQYSKIKDLCVKFAKEDAKD